jgi:hypothetical protein
MLGSAFNREGLTSSETGPRSISNHGENGGKYLQNTIIPDSGSNTTKGRETDADHTPRLHNTLEKLGFEEEKWQLREWMIVARDRSAWGQRVELYLELPTESFTNLRRH